MAKVLRHVNTDTSKTSHRLSELNLSMPITDLEESYQQRPLEGAGDVKRALHANSGCIARQLPAVLDPDEEYLIWLRLQCAERRNSHLIVCKSLVSRRVVTTEGAEYDCRPTSISMDKSQPHPKEDRKPPVEISVSMYASRPVDRLDRLYRKRRDLLVYQGYTKCHFCMEHCASANGHLAEKCDTTDGVHIGDS
jgi:hypothetical protein